VRAEIPAEEPHVVTIEGCPDCGRVNISVDDVGDDGLRHEGCVAFLDRGATSDLIEALEAALGAVTAPGNGAGA
jgi:hypothetical protein